MQAVVFLFCYEYTSEFYENIFKIDVFIGTGAMKSLLEFPVPLSVKLSLG